MPKNKKQSVIRGVILRLAENYGICDKIEFLGYKEDVKPYMEKATAFLMASENEGLGRVTIEAMFYGCLVIARHSGGTLEFLKEGFNGLYFNDDVQLASTMKDVSMILPVEIIKNAQKFVVNNFSEEIYGAKMVKIYNHIFYIQVNFLQINHFYHNTSS